MKVIVMAKNAREKRNAKKSDYYMDIIRQIEKIGDRCFDAAGDLRKEDTAI